MSRLDRRARRGRLLLSAAVVGIALAAAGFVSYQVRYDRDTRYMEVGLFEVPSGADGSAAFRSCLPARAKLTLLNTTGRYQVDFVGTRRDAKRVVTCVEGRPGVQYAARVGFTDLGR